MIYDPLKPTTPDLVPSSVTVPQIPAGNSLRGSLFTIETATEKDFAFLLYLSNKHRDAIGFLPRVALRWYAETGNCILGLQNLDNAGFILGRPRFRWQPLMSPITQAAVAMDAMRRHLGLAMVDNWCARAIARGSIAVQAMCREDLEANLFWLAAGFVEIARYAPGNARQKSMICWRRSFKPIMPGWFFQLPPVAGWKGRRTSPP